MAYLKLGNTHINYGKENTWDRLILSQVLDSGCSYKNPKLVRSVEDLELYFGNSFEDYDYYKELITGGATLYLYKPLTDNYVSLKSGISGWIDLSGYSRFSYIDYSNPYRYPTSGAEYYTEAEYDDNGNLIYFDINEILSKVSEDQRLEVLEKYRENKIFTSIEEFPSKGIVKINEGDALDNFIFTAIIEGEVLDYYYDKVLEEFVCINLLPQSLSPSNYITGKLNHDTLRLTTKNWVNNLGVNAEEEITENSLETHQGELKYTRVHAPFPRIDHCNPRYSSGNYTPLYPDLPEISYTSSQKRQLFTSVNGKESYLGGEFYSLAYTFDFSGTKEEDIKNGNYIVMSDPVNQSGSIFFFGDSEDIPEIGDDEVGGAQRFAIAVDGGVDGLMTKILEGTYEDGEGKTKKYSNWYLGYKEGDYIYHVWNINGVTPNTQFFNIPGLIITPDIELSQDILSVLTEDLWRIEFYSKTIGPGDSDIKVKIEKLDSYNPERYRITISRYSYSEIFEGNLYIKEDLDGRIENLEYIINSGSKLVECKLRRKIQKREFLKYNKATGELKRLELFEGRQDINDIDDGLPEGEWYLKRARKESYIPSDYKRALDEMEKDLRIKEDFLMIPDKKFWNLEDLYSYCNSKNTQSLIVDHKLEYTENIIRDLKGRPKDLENRLVFFLEDMYLNWNKRPGYYLFIRGILGQGYTLPVRLIQYPKIYKYSNPKSSEIKIVPMWDWEYTKLLDYTEWDKLEENKKDPELLKDNYKYLIENPYSDYSKILEKFKSNYLVFNEHDYYYRKLFSHQGDNKYKMTILSKYCQTHVTRVVEREFTQFLSYTYSGDMIDEMNNILKRIRSSNKIISDLYIEYIEEDSVGESLDVHLHCKIREAADKDISLGITLNFNLT
jgi:hypothetical protein